MHPALSVIFFTTVSGAGYGLLIWLGLHYAVKPLPLSPGLAATAFATALVAVTAGLFASMLHLGKPMRAWRAFTQIGTSWLSREGALAVLTYVPTLALVWHVWHADFGLATRALGVATALCALATVFATAMIYASLPTVRAWRDARVPPAYLLFALASGATWLAAPLAFTGWTPGVIALAVFALLTIALAAIKLSYWHAIDRMPAVDPGVATGLAGFGTVRAFEAPHTEANFITREMAFVLARRHARRLRIVALVLFAAVPLICAAIAWLWPGATSAATVVAAAALLAGAFVERWLFFAQARHAVVGYYGARIPGT